MKFTREFRAEGPEKNVREHQLVSGDRFMASAHHIILSATLLMLTDACYRRPNESYWLEIPGHAEHSEVQAAARGLIAIGTNSRLFKYPGGYPLPWVDLGATDIAAVSASKNYFYLLTKTGVLYKSKTGIDRIIVPFTVRGNFVAFTNNEEDSIVTAHENTVLRYSKDGESSIAKVTCPFLIISLGVNEQGPWALSSEGMLYRITEDSCIAVSSPRPAKQVSAYAKKVALVDKDGRGWLKDFRFDEPWHILPAPITYPIARGPETQPLVQISLTEWTTWGLDAKGHVFLLQGVP